MAKYCPVCLGEFKNSVSVCPIDKCSLMDEKPKSILRLVDIYAASGEIEAERIIAFLRAEGIVAKESTTGISQLPVASDNRSIICVLRESINKAKALIERAKNDGVISKNGNFI